LRDDKVFTVVAENFSEDNRYVQSVLLNGKTLKEPTISYADIMSGGELRFTMRKEKEK
jgi:putative alpha-1,2-mannosidase